MKKQETKNQTDEYKKWTGSCPGWGAGGVKWIKEIEYTYPDSTEKNTELLNPVVSLKRI